jgi:hypothetical protein
MDEGERFIPAYGIHERRSIPMDELVAALRAEGWPTYVVPGAPENAEAFFTAVRDALPLDPPVHRAVWDALADSLWEGLHKLYVEKVAIAWPGSARLRDADPEAYGIALGILTDLVSDLADRKLTVDHETRVLVLLG